jgi:hypothetical protein
MKVFYIDVELEPLEGSEHYKKCSGLFVGCYVLAKNEREAEICFHRKIAESKYRLISLDGIYPFEEISFDTSEDQQEAELFAKEAKNTGRFVYGNFYCYEN